MRILHVDTEKGFRGGEQQLLWLVEGLIKNGIDSAVATVKDELYNRCRKKGIKTVRLTGNQLTDWLRLAKEGKNYDIIHAHTAKALNISALAKKINKKPLIYTRRVDYKPKNNIFTKFKYRLSDVVVCVSEAVKDTLVGFVDSKKLRVIYSITDPKLEDSVDLKRVEKIRNSYKGKFIVGTAAALTKQKNIPNLIEAASMVLKQAKDVVFIVAGEGNLKEQLEKQIKSLSIEDRFFLIGFKRDIQNYIKAFDLFVLASDNEGFSGAILNAMILKIPVIVTDAGGAREIVEDNKSGFIVRKRDSKQLADAILKLYREPNLRDRFVDNAYKIVKEKFSVKKMVESYIIVYNELMEVKK
ncbi:glycosyltransferase family 4 protein [Hippea alviniae]|uniref:glycosyltransferase family 4 protein n=1 Tax=Hippea alviniae TaxID=1279027 RepID=UPI0003B72195|nr:glycosyltransferase family 4 protein [Hippea alviniae]